MKCMKCNYELENNTKFCPNCGEKITNNNLKNTTVSNDKSWNPAILIIFPVIWLFMKTYIYHHMGLAEAMGGAVVIALLPLIVTTIIFIIQKIRGIPYYNFTKHTFIGIAIVFALAIAGNINSHNDRRAELLQAEDISINLNTIVPAPSPKKKIETYSVTNYDKPEYIDGDLIDNKDMTLKNSLLSWLKRCEEGSGTSCTSIGFYYRDGTAIRQSYHKAVKWFTKACDLGDATGCHSLGRRYERGQGVRQDDLKATKLFIKACNGDSFLGCYDLGEAYRYGNGVKEDDIKAKEMYGKACDLGSEQGCSRYSRMNN